MILPIKETKGVVNVMKTRMAPNFIVALLLLAAWFTNSPRARAADDAKVIGNTPTVPVVAATNSVAPLNPPAPTAPVVATHPAPAAVVTSFQLPLPPLLDQVVRLGQSGADEKIISAYVEKAASPYQITGNDIIRLRDLGVSPTVILALIEHSQSAETLAPQPAVPAPTVAEPAPASAANATSPATSPIPETEAAADFYSSLSPYGSWQNVPDYGWCWQPTVVVVNPSWQPYCDSGNWLWSDNGWYWNSYYSWGWAPFHYGRWYNPGSGWLWCPDRVWGSSWVSWRNSGSYCGWAPLPPGACYTAGAGWSYRGVAVGVGFGFGLGAAQFTFVAHDRFTDSRVASHAVRGDAASAAYRNTTVINNYAAGANNRVINHGVGRETIAAASRSPIRDVGVRELPRGNGPAVMPDRVTRVGNSSVVYRPGAQISVPRTTTAVQNNPALAARPTGARTGTSTAQPLSRPAAPRTSVPAGTAASRPLPNSTRNYANNSRVTPQQQNGFVAPRSAPMNGRPSRPAQSFGRSASAAPSYAAPRSAPATMSRSMPSGGGMPARGHVSQGGRSMGGSSVSRR